LKSDLCLTMRKSILRARFVAGASGNTSGELVEELLASFLAYINPPMMSTMCPRSCGSVSPTTALITEDTAAAKVLDFSIVQRRVSNWSTCDQTMVAVIRTSMDWSLGQVVLKGRQMSSRRFGCASVEFMLSKTHARWNQLLNAAWRTEEALCSKAGSSTLKNALPCPSFTILPSANRAIHPQAVAAVCATRSVSFPHPFFPCTIWPSW